MSSAFQSISRGCVCLFVVVLNVCVQEKPFPWAFQGSWFVHTNLSTRIFNDLFEAKKHPRRSNTQKPDAQFLRAFKHFSLHSPSCHLLNFVRPQKKHRLNKKQMSSSCDPSNTFLFILPSYQLFKFEFYA